jgi:Transposase DDE domain
MESQLWAMMVEALNGIKVSESKRCQFGVLDIVRTYFWAVLHDRPVSWACRKSSWPLWAWRQELPTPSTMSRRLSTPEVQQVIATLEQTVLRRPGPTMWHALDGKALPVRPHSQDPDAKFGRGTGGLEKGYKLHVIYGQNGSISAWDVEPMNVDERVVARRLVVEAELQGYVVADAYYDDNELYDRVSERGAQLVTPRRHGPGRGLGHHRHSPARLRAIELVEVSLSGFGSALLEQREAIERFYGTLTTAHYGLSVLPPWVRGLRRVRRWVQAKLILDRLASQYRSQQVA